MSRDSVLPLDSANREASICQSIGFLKCRSTARATRAPKLSTCSWISRRPGLHAIRNSGRFPQYTVLIRGQAQRASRSHINLRDGPRKAWHHSRIPENGMRSGASGFGSPRACSFSRDSSSSRMFPPGEIWPKIFHEDHNFDLSCDAPWHACPRLVLLVMKGD